MTRIIKLNLDLEEALSNLLEFKENGDNIESEVSEYLISNGFVQPIHVQVDSISALMKGKHESYEYSPHHIWTPLGTEVYAKLKRHDSLPKVVKPLYELFI